MCRDMETFWSDSNHSNMSSSGDFEVELSADARRRLGAYYRLRFLSEDDDYTPLEEHHLRGDRDPLIIHHGHVYTLDPQGVFIYPLTRSSSQGARADRV